MSKKSPQLRFEGFTDDWEQRKLGEMLEDKTILEQSDGNHGELYPKSSEFAKEGIPYLAASNIIDNNIDYQNVKYLPLLRAEQFKKGVARDGDILLAHNATVGPSALLKINLPFVILSTTLTLYRINKDKMDNLFFLSIIRSNKVQNQLKKMMKQTTRNQVPILAQRTIDIFYPKNLKEQAKVGEFFKQLDDTITLHQRKLDLLKEQKKGYLQKMFPKNGAKVPELRFSGFADDWEERKLGDILSERNDQMPETNEYPLMSFVQGKGVTPKGERYNRSFLVKDSEKKYKKTKLGDFIYSSNNLETGSIGFNRTGKAVISPVYSIFESKKARESLFIGIMSARKDFISEMVRFRQGVVYGQWRIHESDFLNINIKIPNDKEQHLIISLFESIDNTIALHQRKLDLLKEQKKGFLQKMFV